ncbi:MAG: hypothetical protein ACRD5F_09520, partial [Candidatus Acidiferrales bacterium]
DAQPSCCAPPPAEAASGIAPRHQAEHIVAYSNDAATKTAHALAAPPLAVRFCARGVRLRGARTSAQARVPVPPAGRLFSASLT